MRQLERIDASQFVVGTIKRPKLMVAMQRFDFSTSYTAAGQAAYAERCAITTKLVDVIGEHLERTMGKLAA
jgi:hypothetical protein